MIQVQVFYQTGSIKLAGRDLNAGFHGIESPRAHKTIGYLSKLMDINTLKQIDNCKLILLGDNLIPFKSSIDEWPICLANDLNATNISLIESGELNDSEIRSELMKSALGRLMNAISNRYSNNIKDAFHLLYPWFYPFENRFSDKDECYNAQNKVKAGIGSTHYLIPKNGIFSSLIKPISSSLKGSGIKLQTNSRIDIRDQLKNQDINQTNIWAASGLTLSKILGHPLLR